MNRLLRRLAVPRARYCHSKPMEWCFIRAAWVCSECDNRR